MYIVWLSSMNVFSTLYLIQSDERLQTFTSQLANLTLTSLSELTVSTCSPHVPTITPIPLLDQSLKLCANQSKQFSPASRLFNIYQHFTEQQFSTAVSCIPTHLFILQMTRIKMRIKSAVKQSTDRWPVCRPVLLKRSASVPYTHDPSASKPTGSWG